MAGPVHQGTIQAKDRDCTRRGDITAEIQAALAFAASGVLGAFAVLLFGRRGPRNPANLFLALFFILLALNQGLEGLRALDPSRDVLLFRLASAAAVVDPFVMFYFSGLFPRRVARPASPSVLAAFAGTILLLGATPFVAPPVRPTGDPGAWFEALLSVWTALLYLLAFRRFYQAWRDEPNPVRGGGSPVPLLLIAASIAFLPVFYRATSRLIAPMAQDVFLAFGVVLQSLPFPGSFAVLVGLAFGAVQFAPAARRRALAGCLAAGLGSTLFVNAFNAGVTVFGQGVDALYILGQASTSLRWMGFCALASVAVFRHDALGLDPADRQRAARALVALAFVVGAIVAMVLVRAIVPYALPGVFEAAALGAALLLSHGFRSAVDRTAEAVFGLPPRAAGAVPEAPPAMLPEAPFRPEPGRVLGGRYRVEEFLARGGASRVYRAHDVLLGRDVVLKDLPHEGPAAMDRALREARTASALQHPGVLQVFDVLRDRERTILVTEYAPRGSLADRVAAHGPLPREEGLALLDDLLGTLAAVHGQGLVHCDLKPANLLLGADGRLRMADFGIARLRGATARFDQGDVFAGTPEYMSPEQRQGRPATERSDLHALALVARRCIQGPLPPAVEAVLDRALAAQPEARWPSAAAMREALRSARLPVSEQQ